MKSNYWLYREYPSKHFRQNKSNLQDKIKPIYFPEPIDNKQFRKYLRDVLGIKNSEHLDVRISNSEFDNLRAYKIHQYYQKVKPVVKKKIKPKKVKMTLTSFAKSFIPLVRDGMGKSVF